MNFYVKPTLQSSLHFAPDNRRGWEAWANGPYKTAWASEARTAQLAGNTQSRKDYLQRVETDDIITVQFHANTNAQIRILFFGERGEYIRPIFTDTYYTIPGNTRLTEEGVSEQLYTYHLQFSFSELLYASGMNVGGGIFRIGAEFKWPANGGTIPTEQRRVIVSELLFVRPKWPETVLIEAKHRANKDGFIWQQTDAISALRLPATLALSGADGNADIYEDGGSHPVLLSSKPFDTYRLLALQAPEFLVEKLNLLFACSDVVVDGKRVVRPANSTLGEAYSRNRSIDTQLRLQRAEEKGGIAFAPLSKYGTAYPPGTTYITTLPAGYPYTFTTFKVGYFGNVPAAYYSQGVAIANSTERAAYVTGLNAFRRAESPAGPLYGRFVLLGLDLVFIWSELCQKQNIIATITDYSGGIGVVDQGS